MFKTQMEPQAAGEWFHCKVLNISWRHFYGLSECRSWKIVVDLFFTTTFIFLRKTKNQHSIFLVKQLLRGYYYSSLLSVVHNELALLSSWFLSPYNVERETSTRSVFYVCCVYSLLFFC